MTSVENNTIVENSDGAEKKSLVGIIYPPTEVRNIVDKTASFVARNGPDFEVRIRQNEVNNPKFNFLNSNDPYHAYYQSKVKELHEGKTTQQELSDPDAPSIVKQAINQTIQQKQQEILKQLEKPFIPKDPPSDFEFSFEPPSISAMDLDIVKLTALLVARNGRQFLNQLMHREQKNYQFDFLRPQHSLFQYFTKLLEQYNKVLIPPKNTRDRLSRETKESVLEAVKYRAEWNKYKDAERRKEEEIQEKERLAYAQIDWHDFVVVEVVDYMSYEVGNFPPPTTPEEVGARLLMQERIEEGQDIEMQIDSDDEGEKEEPNNEQRANLLMSDLDNDNVLRRTANVVDMEEDSSGDDMDEEDVARTQAYRLQMEAVKSAPVPPPIPDKVLVKKYDPKMASKAVKPNSTTEYLISPLTGEKVPVSKVQEYLHHRLLDSRWVEQREKHIQQKMAEESVYAAGTSIETSLKQLAERRTDIFGFGDEETTIGKKIGEEEVRKDDKITWDGHSSSIEATTRAASSNISIEEQIHQIHKVKGLLTDDEHDKIGPKTTKATIVNISSNTSTAVQTEIAISSSTTMTPNPVVLTQNSIMMPPPTQPIMVPTVPSFMGPQPMVPIQPPVHHNLKHSADTGSVFSEEPVNKKLRTEDSLIPEDMFFAKNASAVSFKVLVPNMTDKPEWKLNGQMISLSMGLTDTVAAIKAKICEEIAMPVAKQKIFYDGMFFKDGNSLAYYNILPGTILHLYVKERGGRKK